MKLALIDTNCLAHKSIQIADKYALTDEQKQIYFCAVIMWADSLGFVPKLRDRDDTFSCWLTDSKPYWRNTYAEDYKAGRERSYETHASLDLFHSCFDLCDVPVLAFPGYEADDIAGAIVKLWSQGERNINELFLVTVDSDWQGLVIEDNVCWLNMLDYEPRARRTIETYQWLCKDWNKAAKYKQRAFELPSFSEYSSTDIWKWKGASGDKSDNIKPGAGHWITDLFEQPAQFNLANHSKQLIFEFIGRNLIRRHDWFHAEQLVYSRGLPLPIEPIDI
jgi:5'-3' exonuclease